MPLELLSDMRKEDKGGGVMKQIFDWLREQIKSGKREQHSMIDVSWNNAIKMCLQVINEAEAKWEKDCCEWTPMKYLEFQLSDCLTSCGHAEHYSTGIDKYCRHCGKRIKIREVE